MIDYTEEVTNRFKGLDLIDRVPKELWTEIHDIVQEEVIKTIPKKKKCKNAKPMGFSKRSSKRKVYSNTILPQETRKTSNRQPNFTPKTTGNRRTKNHKKK